MSAARADADADRAAPAPSRSQSAAPATGGAPPRPMRRIDWRVRCVDALVFTGAALLFMAAILSLSLLHYLLVHERLPAGGAVVLLVLCLSFALLGRFALSLLRARLVCEPAYARRVLVPALCVSFILLVAATFGRLPVDGVLVFVRCFGAALVVLLALCFVRAQRESVAGQAR
jgi:hypothetical protein